MSYTKTETGWAYHDKWDHKPRKQYTPDDVLWVKYWYRQMPLSVHYKICLDRFLNKNENKNKGDL